MSLRDIIARRLHRIADRISDDEAMHHIGFTMTIEDGIGAVLHGHSYPARDTAPTGCDLWVYGKDQHKMEPDRG